MAQQPIPPCPHCGTVKQGVTQKQQVHGWIDRYYFDDGDHESNQDNLVYGRAGPIRCLYCQHVRTDVRIVLEGTREVVQIV
jgi:hypothetical protein